VGHVVEPDTLADGRVIGYLRVREGFDGPVVAEVPAKSLADEAPLYHRPLARPSDLDAIAADDPTDTEPEGDLKEQLLDLLVDPAWVYRQYDSQLFLNTVVGPGRDAALLRLAGPGLPSSSRGISVSTDSNPRWCALDPRVGTALTVAESAANLACVGATPKALVNCLNFGNPTHPEVMWQLSESVDGMAEACLALGIPVVGGNVSLYNESGGKDIDPTPVVGLLGVVESLVSPPPGWNWREGDSVVLVGFREAAGDAAFPLAGSRWATRRGRRGGRLAAFEPSRLAPTLAFVAAEVASICAGHASDVTAVHDVSGGGLAAALAEMVAVSGQGARLEALRGRGEYFAEFPGRFVVATSDVAAFTARCAAAGVPSAVLGTVGGDALVLGDLVLSAAEVTQRRSGALEGQLNAN
jgi:phosphoribosylformylglycinamidine synthase